MGIFLFIVILFVLVLVHEFGHFYTAKKLGIRVLEFGFGFPPKLWGKKIGDTEYTINAIPFGGFVRIFGEQGDSETANTLGSFSAQPAWKKALVMIAGVVCNFLLAWVLYTTGFMIGMPTAVSPEEMNRNTSIHDIHLLVTEVRPSTPAALAGIIPGDIIVSLSSKGKIVTESITPQVLQDYVASHGAQKITIDIIRAQQPLTVEVVPEISDKGAKPVIGVAIDLVGTVKLGLLDALSEGFTHTVQMLKMTISQFGTLIRDAVLGKANLDQVSGPIGIARIVGSAYEYGILYVLSIAALISINLAVLNLIPFPALDGGRLLFLFIEKITGKHMSPKILGIVNMVGFGILILLMIVVTFKDIMRLI